MLIAIDIGHNQPGVDTGAVGYKSEDPLAKAIGEDLIERLTKHNITCLNVTPKSAKSLGDSLLQRSRKANNWNADLFVSIHLNAASFKAHGVETLVYAKSHKVMPFAASIQRKMASLGYADRGIKVRRDLSVLRRTKMPAILVECGFVTNQSDMQKFSSKDFGKAIFEGIIENIEVVPPPKEPDLSDTIEQGTLKILQNGVILKPNTDQFNQYTSLEKKQIIVIPKGEYPELFLVCNEENHKLILFPELKIRKSEIYKGIYRWVYNDKEFVDWIPE